MAWQIAPLRTPEAALSSLSGPATAVVVGRRAEESRLDGKTALALLVHSEQGQRRRL